MTRLEYKLHIGGTLTVETGLHIGGSEVELDIGGIDHEVIKIKEGRERIPYIPGSSLKGKLRNLLAKKYGYSDVRFDEQEVKLLFGKTGKPKNEPARLIFRDSYWKPQKTDEKDDKKKQAEKREKELKDTLEDKAENVIDRSTGGAKPRHLERVTKGSTFTIDIIMDVYSHRKYKDENWRKEDEHKLLETLDMGFQLLQKDYLGGSGTRGYGKVSLKMDDIKVLDFKANGEVDESQIHDYKFKVSNTDA